MAPALRECRRRDRSKKTIQARELWNELTVGARDWAEPGCLFWDTIRRYSSSDRYSGMEVVSTNPCAEEPLETYGDCCIGSINLAAFVNDSHTQNASWISPPLRRPLATPFASWTTCLLGMRGAILFSGQEEAALRGRRIGLGIMGLADMLCKLNLRYDSDQESNLPKRRWRRSSSGPTTNQQTLPLRKVPSLSSTRRSI